MRPAAVTLGHPAEAAFPLADAVHLVDAQGGIEPFTGREQEDAEPATVSGGELDPR